MKKKGFESNFNGGLTTTVNIFTFEIIPFTFLEVIKGISLLFLNLPLVFQTNEEFFSSMRNTGMFLDFYMKLFYFTYRERSDEPY